MKNLFFPLVLFSNILFAQTDKNKVSLTIYNPDKIAITIYAYDALYYENDTLLTIKTDSIVKKTINFSSPRFVTIKVLNKRQSLYLDGGYNINIYIDKNKNLYFDGWGSDINNYLSKYVEFKRTYEYKDKSISDLEYTDFFNAMDDFESKFMQFHNRTIMSNKITDKRSSILENIGKTYTLSLKYNRYGVWKTSKDSTLKKLLEENINDFKTLFSKPELLKLYSDEYLSVLSNYPGIDQTNVGSLENPFTPRYAYLQQSNFENNIKEYLLANLIFASFKRAYNTTIFDDLYNRFSNTYPNSLYINIINKRAIEFAEKIIAKGKNALALSGQTPVGKEIVLDDLKGKPILVDVWATWCGPCITQKPAIEALQKKFKNIIFLYVSVDRDKESWLKAVKNKNEMNAINIIQTEEETNLMWKNYIALGVPRYIIIDSQGKIANAKVSLKEVESILAKL